MLKCKICGARIEDDVAVCPSCGAKVAGGVESPSTTARDPTATTGTSAPTRPSSPVIKTICAHCGAEVIGEHRFCPQCGKALDGGKEDTPATQAATTPQKKKGKKLVIGSIIGVCLVLVIAFCTSFIIAERKKEHMQKELLLGLEYYIGQDVEQDYAKAVEHLQKAADLGDADAHYYLGECYYNGQGVAQDYTKAYEYYRKAADQGNSNAKEALEQLGVK